MDHTPEFRIDRAIPDWQAPDRARDTLHAEMSRFFDRAQAALGTGQAPALALRVSPGLGKTRTALRLIAERGNAILAHGHVAFHMPTLDLAERAAAEFEALKSGLPVAVLRGRSALDPKTGKPMCARAEFAARISRCVRSVTEAICIGRDAGGRPVLADCARNCPYLDQKHAEPRVVFLSQQYLVLHPPLEGTMALRIIDERFWPTLTETASLFVEDWMAPPVARLSQALEARHLEIRSTVLHALQSREPVLSRLRERGISPDLMRLLAQCETNALADLDLHPGQATAEQERLLQAHDFHAMATGRKRAGILRLLAEAIARDGTERLSLARIRVADGVRSAIRLHVRKDLPADAPLLMLDADADPSITRQFAPHAAFRRIDARPEAEIVQTGDLTLSNAWLLHHDRARAHRDRVARIIRAEVTRAAGGNVLVVATRGVLRKLHEDAGTPLECGDETLRQPLHGAEARWFGPRMLGINDYAAFRTIVVVGRLQPRVETIEDAMRCVFADGARPLRLLATTRFEEDRGLRLRSDGRIEEAPVQTHPDPAGRAILEQSRECMTTQAVARLRLIAPAGPKRVVILGNLPLPDLPVTRVTTLRGLEAGLEAEDDINAWLRLERAIATPEGPCPAAIRLSAAGLAEDLPNAFGSLEAARHFRRERRTEDLAAMLMRMATRFGWPATELVLDRESVNGKRTGGKPTPAIVFAPPAKAAEAASASWPHLVARPVWSCREGSEDESPRSTASS